MADIRFVGLTQADQKTLMGRLCRRLQEAAQERSKTVVLTPDEALAEWFDERLWDFDEGSFLPHQRIGDTIPSPLNSVLVTHRDRDRWRADIFVNFGPEALSTEQLEQTTTVYEIFRMDTPDGQQSGRLRWSAYKTAGQEPVKETL